jgi:hypothetical protein
VKRRGYTPNRHGSVLDDLAEHAKPTLFECDAALGVYGGNIATDPIREPAQAGADRGAAYAPAIVWSLLHRASLRIQGRVRNSSIALRGTRIYVGAYIFLASRSFQ